MRKVATLFNCSGVLTKYLNPELLKSHLTRLGVVSHFLNCKLEQQRVSHPLKLNSEGELVTENCLKHLTETLTLCCFKMKELLETARAMSAQKFVTLFDLADTDF